VDDLRGQGKWERAKAFAFVWRCGYNGLMEIDYTVQIWREGSQFIAHAMPLDVASCGETPEAARLALDEAVKLFIKTAKEHGTLDDVLEEAGYTRLGPGWKAPDWVCFERHSAPVAA
jgi:predicted RNase H-like HicB family nuclease